MKIEQVAVDQVTLAVRQQGAGVPVLLVHGFPLDGSMWASLTESLVQTGHRVVVPDLRGYGQSTLGPDDGSIGVAMCRYADDLAELLDRIGVIEPVVFVGFSMGGYIAFEFHERYRARVRALVLVDTRAGNDTPEGALTRHKMARHVHEWGASHVADMMLPRLFAADTLRDRPAVAEPTRRVIATTAPAAIAAAQLGMASRADSGPRLPGIEVPVLAVVGEHDALSPPAEMQSLAAAVPNGRCVVIPGAGHMSPVENPAACFDAVTKFLGELAG